jgi:membrane protein DedA with SNARE-associated domain
MNLVFLASIAKLAVIFIWTFAASLGFPGALVVMVSSGALATNITNLFWIILAAGLWGIIGDMTAYTLAKRFSLITYKKLKKFKFFINNEKKVREELKEYEFSFVFFTRFSLSWLCAPVSYISGFERLNRKKFFLAVVSGEILYAILYPLIGFLFKSTWNDLINSIQYIVLILILVAILILIIRYIIRRKKRIINSIESTIQ